MQVLPPGERVTLERAKELELQAAYARARRSAETVQDILARTKDGEYPEFEIQVGGGAGSRPACKRQSTSVVI